MLTYIRNRLQNLTYTNEIIHDTHTYIHINTHIPCIQVSEVRYFIRIYNYFVYSNVNRYENTQKCRNRKYPALTMQK